MLDDGVGNEQRELASLHEISQQEGVLGSQRGGIKYAGLDVHARASDGKSSGVQVSNAKVWLKHVLLKGYEPQLLGSADQVRTISYEPQLKAIVLGRISDG
jgi:hypothetical protein